MTRWSSFVAFVEMRQEGRSDAVYRNYNLLRNATTRTVRVAMRRAGFDIVEASRLDLQAVMQRLTDVGIQVDRPTVEVYLKEWWTWDRLVQGEVFKWAYRSGRKGSLPPALLASTN